MKTITVIVAFMILMVSTVIAQEKTTKVDSVKKGKSVYIELKEDVKADVKVDVYIDGKKYDPDILDVIDQEKIDMMEVFKGDEAMKRYNSDNVIVITTKSKAGKSDSKIIIRDTNSDINTATATPVIMIDGKKADKKALEALKPENILSVSVIKGEQALSEYNSETGVVLVITKGKK